jgi:hypothetical protein
MFRGVDHRDGQSRSWVEAARVAGRFSNIAAPWSETHPRGVSACDLMYDPLHWEAWRIAGAGARTRR